MKEAQTQTQITQAFSAQAPRAIANLADNQKAILEKQLGQENDPTKKAELVAEIVKWDEGGIYRTALHSVAGAASGGVGGALGAGVISGLSNQLSGLQEMTSLALKEQGMSSEVANTIAQGFSQLTSIGIGYAAGSGSGAASSISTDTNNRMMNYANYQRVLDGCKGSNSGECQTLRNMVGIRSGMPREVSAIPNGKVVENYDANNKVVSYTIVNKNSNQPTLITEPVEYAAYLTSGPGIQAMLPLQRQYAIDLSSASLYAMNGSVSKALETFVAGYTSQDYVFDMAVGAVGAAASYAGPAKSLSSFANRIPGESFSIEPVPYLTPEQALRTPGKILYVVKEDSSLIIARTNSNNLFGHFDLANGENILAGGEGRIYSGQVKMLDNASGHYLPEGPQAQNAAVNAFKDAGFKVPDGAYVEKFYDFKLGKWTPKK